MGPFVSTRRWRAAIAWSGLLALLVSPSSPSLFTLVPPAHAAAASLTAPSTDFTALGDLQSRFQSIAERVSPAVVAISASFTADTAPEALRSTEMNGEKLQAFLSKTTRMVGTGFLIQSNGYLLTNDHVIDDAEQIWVTTDDKKVYPALVVGSDPRSDLAVLKIPAHHLPVVHFADGSRVQRGQWSIAIGNPYGFSAEGEMCVSVGVISAVDRSLPKLSSKEKRLYSDLIQTTAQINPGNSGGPLIDLNGNVIGVNTAVILPHKSTNGIGFALPIDAHLLAVVEDLKQGKEIVYGDLGVTTVTPTEQERQSAGLKKPVGARVESIQPASPAADGKLHENDLIVGIDGQLVRNSEDFVRLVGASPINRPVQLSFLRDGKPMKVSVTLGKCPLPVAAVTRENQRLRWGGMLVGPIPNGQTHEGLMVFGIDPASPFTKFGIHQGTVIKSIAGKPVTGLTDLQGILNDTPPDRCDIGIAADLATAVVSVEH